MLAPPNGAWTSIPSHPTLYCFSPFLDGGQPERCDSWRVSRKKTPPLNNCCQTGLSRRTHSDPASRRRRARFLPNFHSPQRLSRSQHQVQQLLVPQFLPNRVPIYGILLVWSSSLNFQSVLSPAYTWIFYVDFLVHLHELAVQFSHSAPPTPLEMAWQSSPSGGPHRLATLVCG